MQNAARDFNRFGKSRAYFAGLIPRKPTHSRSLAGQLGHFADAMPPADLRVIPCTGGFSYIFFERMEPLRATAALISSFRASCLIASPS